MPVRIDWNDETVRWFDSAFEYTNYHQALAARLLDRITRRDSLLDLGCGAGLIDFVLARDIRSITCVDHSPGAVDAVRVRAEALALSGIEAVRMDARAVRGTWDNVLMVLFGDVGTMAAPCLKLCREQVLCVVHGDPPEDGAYHRPRRTTLSTVCASLGAQGVRYTQGEVTLEYGQPFTDARDAARYIRTYEKNPPGTTVEAYIESALTPIAHEKYQFYLPCKKRLGIVTIRRDENEHL